MINPQQDNNQNARDNTILTCPYLGSRDDHTIWFNYPCGGNYCYKVKPSRNILLDHQEKYCLTPLHTQCQIYHSSKIDLFSINFLSSPQEKTPKWSISKLQIIAIITFLTVSIILSGFIYSQSNPIVDNNITILNILLTDTLTPTIMITKTQNPPLSLFSPLQTNLPSPTTPNTSSFPTVTISPIPSSTVETQLTPGPALLTPFGPQNQYLLYQIKEGEGLFNLAVKYQTSIEVIKAANDLIEGASIWPGTVLVIIPGQKDPTLVEKFKVIYIDQVTTVEQLALKYGVSAEEISQYNGLGSSNIIPVGRWIIIPIN